MIRGDASVWIDCFRGTATPQAERLDALPGSEPRSIGDLTLTEVLQSFGSQRDFDQARTLLTGMDAVDIGGQDIAIQAARNDRVARAWHHDPQDDRYADRHPLHRIGLRVALQRPRLRPFRRTSWAEHGDELNRAVVEEGGKIRGNSAASILLLFYVSSTRYFQRRRKPVLVSLEYVTHSGKSNEHRPLLCPSSSQKRLMPKTCGLVESGER